VNNKEVIRKSKPGYPYWIHSEGLLCSSLCLHFTKCLIRRCLELTVSVRAPVRVHVSAGEAFNKLWWNVVHILCLWRPANTAILNFPLSAI